jgi:hypothetical protein
MIDDLSAQTPAFCINRLDIIRMAREAGLAIVYNERDEDGWQELERFAKLVAAHEREKVAQWMMERGYATGHGNTIQELIKEVEWQVAELENEACAKVAENIISDLGYVQAKYSAADIRARGEK